MRSVEDRIAIRATPERVWSVLTGFARYGEWNPFIREISGELAVGARLLVRIHPPGGTPMVFRPRLQVVAPGSELRWLGHLLIAGVFDGEHAFHIEPGREVSFRQSERFRGLLTPFLPASMYERTRRGFEEMDRALKRRVEA